MPIMYVSIEFICYRFTYLNVSVPYAFHFLKFFKGCIIVNHMDVHLCILSINLAGYLFLFSLFGHTAWLVGSQFPDQRSNPCPQW